MSSKIIAELEAEAANLGAQIDAANGLVNQSGKSFAATPRSVWESRIASLRAAIRGKEELITETEKQLAHFLGRRAERKKQAKNAGQVAAELIVDAARIEAAASRHYTVVIQFSRKIAALRHLGETAIEKTVHVNREITTSERRIETSQMEIAEARKECTRLEKDIEAYNKANQPTSSRARADDWGNGSAPQSNKSLMTPAEALAAARARDAEEAQN